MVGYFESFFVVEILSRSASFAIFSRVLGAILLPFLGCPVAAVVVMASAPVGRNLVDAARLL